MEPIEDFVQVQMDDIPAETLNAEEILTKERSNSKSLLLPPSFEVYNVVKNRANSLLSLFMLYFLVTVLFWGTADFLLSFLATRAESLTTGDTLALLSIGNFLGMIIARLVLWQWSRTSWAKLVACPCESASPIEPIPASSPPVTNKNKFARMRSMIKRPLFLDDGYKLTFMSGMIGAVAPLGYYRLSIGGGQASTVAPLISLYVIIPTILGLFVLKERKNIPKFLGIACAVGAVTLFALGGGTAHWSLMNWENMGYFSLGFFGWGISYFIRSIAVSKDVEFAHLLLMATAGLMFGNYLLIIFVYGVSQFRFTLAHGLTLISGCSQVLGDLGFFLLSREGKEASRVVPLTGTYILLPSLLGFIFLHDSITIMKIAAIILSLVALVLLGAS